MQNSSYPKDEYRAIEAVQDRHWWFQGRKLILSYFLRHALKGKESYIEIGCGTGYLLDIPKGLGGIRISGVDMHEESVRIARQRCKDARIFPATIDTLDSRDTFDVVGIFDVIEHIEDDRTAMKQLAKHVKKDGYILITVPQHKWLFSEADKAAGHFRRYSRHDLRRLLIDSGFRIVFCTSFVSFALPAMWIKRVMSSHNREDSFSWEEELRINKITNQALGLVSLFEYLLIRLRISLPVGGSLFVLCRKSL